MCQVHYIVAIIINHRVMSSRSRNHCKSTVYHYAHLTLSHSLYTANHCNSTVYHYTHLTLYHALYTANHCKSTIYHYTHLALSHSTLQTTARAQSTTTHIPFYLTLQCSKDAEHFQACSKCCHCMYCNYIHLMTSVVLLAQYYFSLCFITARYCSEDSIISQW